MKEHWLVTEEPELWGAMEMLKCAELTPDGARLDIDHAKIKEQ